MTVKQTKHVEVDERRAGQRIDNFLLSHFHKVPKSRIYRALRSGEVRVNKKRVKPIYRIQLGDIVRIPPIQHGESTSKSVTLTDDQKENLEQQIIFENEHLLVINKPAGIAAHSGSGDRWGVIEGFRASREHQPFLELAHRIDKETSGCLVMAKSRRALLDIQQSLHAENSIKQYELLVKGHWNTHKMIVEHSLEKRSSSEAGAKMKASELGIASRTIFTMKELFNGHTLMTAIIETGRTHQIRVHAQLENHPIAGDKRYGDFEYNRNMQKIGLKRMFLHASYLKLHLSDLSQTYEFNAVLPNELKQVCRYLRRQA
ncbi:MAG: RluA family pseudouridine synthase [Pseudomonadota bacterium]